MTRDCTTCDGTGKLTLATNPCIICEICEGEKRVKTNLGRWKKCPSCYGKGISGHEESNCVSCGGSGLIDE